MFLFLGVLLATVIAYILRFHYEIVHAFYLSLKIDGPSALPIIGNGLLFLNNSSAGKNKSNEKHWLKTMAKLRSFLRTENFDLIIGLVKQYGDFFRVWLGPELNIIVSNPKDVEVSHEL